MLGWFKGLFSQRRKLVQLVVILLVLILFGLGGKIFYDRFKSRADTLNQQQKQPKFISNKVLIKLKPDAGRTVSAKGANVTPTDTGLNKINIINKELKVTKSDKVITSSQL